MARRGVVSLAALALSRLGVEASARCEADACAVEDDTSLLQKVKRHSFLATQGADVVKYVKALVKDSEGRPNPRISCTPGSKVAIDYIVGELEKLGAEPLGEDGKFTQLVPHTKMEGCEDGISNVIGVLRGTSKPDEFVVVGAHHDGPNNQGNEFAIPGNIGNQDTDDSYDDASGSAALLAMAKEFAANRPDYSVVLFFTAAEEGFHNVGISGDPIAWKVCRATSDMWKQWGHPEDPYNVMCPGVDGAGGELLSNFPIGSTAWAMNPTFDVSKVRVFIGLDPLGSPGLRGSDFMAVIGAERFPGLPDMLKKGLERDTTVHPVYIARNTVGRNYGDLDPFYLKGVPAIWIAQPGFQAYHGGMEYTPPLSDLLDTFPTKYWALDRFCSLDLDALVQVTGVLTEMVRSLATEDGTPRPVKRPEISYFTVADAQNAVATYTFLIDALGKGSSVTMIDDQDSQRILQMLQQLKGLLEQCLATMPGSDPTAQIPQQCEVGVKKLAGVAMAMDFLSTRLGAQGIVGDTPTKFPIKCKVPQPPK